MTLAILCSGQGNQHPDMFALTADAPQAAGVFAAATDALGGRDPRVLVKTARANVLQGNLEGQILCCAQALAGFAVLAPAPGLRLAFAGYSVGELASWGCAGLLPAEAVIDLARRRALLMDQAGGPDDGLAFVRGLRRAALDDLCHRHGADIAILNPGDMVVVGGARDALERLCAEALAAGAVRVGPLKVAVASHTPRLAAAAPPFRQALGQALTPQTTATARLAPGHRLFSGIDGAPVLAVPAGLDKLAAQIAQTIDWAACLEACVEAGIDRMLELGPGNALATMAAATYPAVRARALDDFRTLDGVRAWLA